MDELVLEGETYFSTKRAAKETGYAKDYVGQLCREGRVTARLVGRSWYVLASAIREHRFGASEPEVVKATTGSAAQPPRLAEPVARELPSLAWEPARYESVPNTPLPNINRLHESAVALKDSEKDSVQSVATPVADTSDMQSVWSEWFEKMPSEAVSQPPPSSTEVSEEEAPRVLPAVPTERPGSEPNDALEDDATVIALRPIVVEDRVERVAPVIEVATDDWEKEEQAEAVAVQRSRDRAEAQYRKDVRTESATGGAVWSIFAVVMALVAILFVATAVAGSGYIDNYLVSFKQASNLSGIYKLIK